MNASDAEYDCIVVGAGPAGSTAARLLARSGAKVLMLDRAAFPRDKPCGGGVTIQAGNEIDLDLSPVVERTITKAQISFKLGEPFQREADVPLTYMTQRGRLDAYLAGQAIAAGVEFHDGSAVASIEHDTGTNIVRVKGDAYRGRTLIGADGANGVTANALGLVTGQRRAAVALEGNIALNGATERWAETVALDLGSVPGGYGWLFPKGDHVNVGVGGWKYVGPTLRERLSRLCGYLGFDESQLTNLRGHHLPLRDAGAPIATGGALLAGDSAGLVDPLSGEGIHAAFASGRLASDAVQRYLAGDAHAMRSYQNTVDGELMPEIEVSYKLQAVFHRFPRLSVAVFRRSDRFWNRLVRLVRGETSYSETESHLGVARYFFQGLAKACAVGMRR